MPTDPAVGSAVQVKARSSQHNGLYGVVEQLIAGTTYNEPMALVSLRPAGQSSGTYNNLHNRQKFRYTELKVLSGGTTDQAQVAGNSSKVGSVEAGDALYTPTPAERRDTPGGGYNGVEPQATLG